MGYIALLISIILLIFSLRDNRGKLVMPKTLFFALWTFILGLSVLNLYNITKPSALAYSLILIMLVCFYLGDYIAKLGLKKIVKLEQKTKNKKNKKTKYSNLKNKIIKQYFHIVERLKKLRAKLNKNPKYTIIYILSILFFIFTIVDVVIVIKNLIDGVPMHTIRRWRMGTFGVDNNPILDRRIFVEEVFRSVILAPYETLMPAIAAYAFFDSKETKKNKYALMIISILVLILSSVAGGGGRLGFIYYFGCFLLAFLVNAKQNIKFDIKKYKKIIIAILVLGFLATFILTQMRTSHGFIKQVYTYFALPPTLLSIWLPKIVDVPPTYGMLTTFGIHSYFFRGLDAIGMDFLIPSVYNDTFQHLLNAEKFMQVGYGVGNAFVSPVYYFMIDGGIPFLCIASMFFGYCLNMVYNAVTRNINLFKFVIYALIMQGVFLTFIRIQTTIPAYIISFVLAFIILDRVENKSEKERGNYDKD